MKNLFFSLLFISGMFFSSGCIKDEQNAPSSLDLSKTATIKGQLKAQLDLLNDTLGLILENAPSGTKVIFKVNASQYIFNPEGTYDDLLFETTIGDNGIYSFDIPATSRGISVTIMPVDFLFDQGQRKLQDGHWVADTPVRKKFTAGSTSVNNIVVGYTKVQDFNYSDQ